MKKKITLKDLDFDYDVSGKGTKVSALKDMGVHNMDFDSMEDLYTNEYFKDTTDWTEGGDPLSEVLDYDDIGDSDYILD